jgi:hypothetical protein
MHPAQIDLLPRSDGGRYHRVTLMVEADGGLTLNSHKMGAAAEAAWGSDDEEITLKIASRDVGHLALALARELLMGRHDALGRLSEICDDAGVPCRIAGWS